MRPPVFVDTSAWVGYFATGDAHHPAAVETLDRLGREGREFMTTDYVLSETVTRLAQQANRKAAAQAWDAIESGGQVRLVEVTRDHRKDGRRLFDKFDKLTLSMTDCTSFAVMRKLGLTEAATFDEDFVKVGFVARPLRK